MASDFTPISASESIDQVTNGALLVDVRTAEEWNAGHIEGAVHIPLDLLNQSYGSHAVLDKAKLEGRRILIHCKTGPRAEHACHLLTASGHQNVACAEGYLKLAEEILKRRQV